MKVKKSIINSMLAMGVSLCHAGSVGPAFTAMSSLPFISIEGSYAWTNKLNLELNTINSNITQKPWGGRLSAGIIRPVTERFSVSGEFGGGYYGSKHLTIVSQGVDANRTIDGYDLLLGVHYSIKQFGIFGGAGAMMQNRRIRVSRDYSKEYPGGFISGEVTEKYNQTEALPEIRVGGLYHLCDNWAISLAYMHVFGSNMESNLKESATPSGISYNGTINTQNQTLNLVMLGLRYNIGDTIRVG